MKRHLFSYLLLSFLSIFFLLLFKNASVQAAAPSFSAQMLPPSNQQNDHVLYFDLKVDPNQAENLQINIQNLIDKDNIVKVTPVVATTANSGNAVYGISHNKPDSSLKYPFTKMVGLAQTVKLKPHEQKTVTFHLQIPEQPFAGLIMGGFDLRSVDHGSVTASNSSSNYKYADINYSIGVILSSSAYHGEKVLPELKAGHPKLIAQVGSPYVVIPMRNPQPNYIKMMTIKTLIVQKSDHKKFVSNLQRALSVAANSKFNYQVSWSQKSGVQAGNYIVTVSAEAGKQSWQFRRNLIVTGQEASALNQKNPYQKHDYTPMITVLIILVVILMATFSWLLFYKGRQRGRQGLDTKSKRK